MRLIDLDEIEFEPFILVGDDDEVVVDYISKDALNNMPVIDRVCHGKWIKNIKIYESVNPDKIWATFNCSECGYQDTIASFHVGEWEAWQKDHWSPELHKFCSGCGALMDLED